MVGRASDSLAPWLGSLAPCLCGVSTLGIDASAGLKHELYRQLTVSGVFCLWLAAFPGSRKQTKRHKRHPMSPIHTNAWFALDWERLGRWLVRVDARISGYLANIWELGHAGELCNDWALHGDGPRGKYAARASPSPLPHVVGTLPELVGGCNARVLRARRAHRMIGTPQP